MIGNEPINAVPANAPVNDSALVTAIDAIPGVGYGALWNMGRGSRTIFEGPKGMPARFNTPSLRSSFHNTMNPRYIRRFGSYSALYNTDNQYTPFQVLARGANRVFNTQTARGGAGGLLNVANPDAYRTSYRGVSFRGKQYGQMDDGVEYFSPGTLARLTAVARLGSHAGNSSIGAFLDDAAGRMTPDSAKLFWHLRGSPRPGQAAVMSRQNAGVAIAATAKGAMAQKIIGYGTGAYNGLNRTVANRSSFLHQEMLKTSLANVAVGHANAADDLLKAGYDVVDGRLMQAGSRIGNVRAFTGSAARAVSRDAGTRAAGMAGMKIAGARMGMVGAKFAGPIGWALLAYDAGKLVGEGIKSAISFVGDANESMMGSIQKPIFGMGYKDTQLAATSRARGVMAIQNSRLNMRSMIGSEAGMLAAHFG